MDEESIKLGVRKDSSSLSSSKESTAELVPNSSQSEWVVVAKKVCVGAVMGTVWILLLLPIIFYHLPEEIDDVSWGLFGTVIYIPLSVVEEATC